jgi:GNAT superfamily N-acetyltransferase
MTRTPDISDLQPPSPLAFVAGDRVTLLCLPAIPRPFWSAGANVLAVVTRGGRRTLTVQVENRSTLPIKVPDYAAVHSSTLSPRHGRSPTDVEVEKAIVALSDARRKPSGPAVLGSDHADTAFSALRELLAHRTTIRESTERAVLPDVLRNDAYRTFAFRASATFAYDSRVVAVAMTADDALVEVVGTATCAFRGPSDPEFGDRIDYIYVHKEHRRRKVGTMLWKTLEAVTGRRLQHAPATESGKAFADALTARGIGLQAKYDDTDLGNEDASERAKEVK